MANDNRVALVTGSGTGLGKAIAASLVNEGMTVVLTGRREDVLQKASEEIGKQQTLVIPGDMTSEASVQKLRDELLEQTDGRLDILVNNVGGVPARGPIDDLTLDQWQQVIDKNATSQFLVTKYMLPALRKRERGAIIAVTSGLAHFYMKGFGAYSAGKAAAEGLIQTVAEEEKANGLQVELLDPGSVATDVNPHGENDPMDVAAGLVDMIR
ncbi:SDR family oxidoreductase [Barrientosiimonas marina]|uniref:SDR family oxidoreductase n=1 Tax=Lentibacillus kimchii TaxID=1542911 RepID=A0ABW2UX37_9BACI